MTIRLLVADDSPTIRKVVALSFLGEDVVVEGAESGEEALQKAGSWRPDVVLVDALMADCPGYELCRRVKAIPELAQTRILLLVGALQPFDESEAAAAGCDGRLTKPFDSRELVNMVRDLLDRSSPSALPADATHFASSRTVRSFLSDERILDLVDLSNLPLRPEPAIPDEAPSAAAPVVEDVSTAAGEGQASVELDALVEARIRQLAPGIIRELAEEIVKDLLSSRTDTQTEHTPRG